MSRWIDLLSAVVLTSSVAFGAEINPPPPASAAADAAMAAPDEGTRFFQLSLELNSLVSSGRWKEALASARETTRLAEKLFGPSHAFTVANLARLGFLCEKMADYAQADRFYRRTLTLAQQNRNTLATEEAWDSLGALANATGDYAEAERCFRQALQLKEARLGPEDSSVAITLGNLGSNYVDLGDYGQAEQLYQRALQINQRALGANSQETSAALNNLGLLYHERGDYAKAESLYQRALQIVEGKTVLDPSGEIKNLRNLASLYADLGDANRAGPLLQRCLRLAEEQFGPDHPETANSLEHLAMLYDAQNQTDRALSLVGRTVKIRQQTQGPEHPATAASVSNLATVHFHRLEYASAIEGYEQALKIKIARFGSNHIAVALSLSNLAVAYAALGNAAAALPLLEQSLKIDQTKLGPGHPRTTIDLANLAEVCYAQGDTARALELTRNMVAAQELTLANIFSFASERQRLAWRGRSAGLGLPCALGNADLIARVILRQKGVVLDSLVEDQRVTAQLRQAGPDKLQRLRSLRQGVLRFDLNQPADQSDAGWARWREAEQKARRDWEQAQRELARTASALGRTRRALDVTADQVTRALHPKSALVEFVRYDQPVGLTQREGRYGALVFSSQRPPAWIALHVPAAVLEQKLSCYQKIMHGEFIRTDEFRELLADLYAQVWSAIDQALPPGTDEVLVAPDGELNFLSFATLWTPRQKFLGQEYRLGYVGSGRDLLLTTTVKSGRALALWASPQYDRPQPAAPRPSEVDASGARGADLAALEPWMPLAGMDAEVKKLAAQADRLGLRPVQLFAGTNATERALRAVKGPYVVHLATHGFFWQMESDAGRAGPGPAELDVDRSARPMLAINPMYRSGVALAGANDTLAKWKQGQAPLPEDDGILLAAEAAGLDLEGTWLAVLSACDTGRGQARSGEGVLGLRRAFVQAGAQHLLLTLWNVNDQYSVEWMPQFYEAALQSGDPLKALADLQRRELVRLREQRGLVAAAQLAGAYVLSLACAR